MVLLVCVLLQTGTHSLAAPVYEVPMPMMCGEPRLEKPFTLTPRWKIEDLGKIEVQSLRSIESNLENWRQDPNSMDIVKCIPQKAVTLKQEEIADEYSYRGLSKQRSPFGNYYFGKATAFFETIHYHKPWHIAFQSRWPLYFDQETVLLYEVINRPTTSQPNYFGIVCSMPNIRCKAKTIELLEEQLLKQYANYLETLLEDNVPVSQFPDEMHHPRFWVPMAPVKNESNRAPVGPKKPSGPLPPVPIGYWDLPEAYRYLGK